MTGFVTAFAALALVALAGCEDKHIGRPCCLGDVCPPPADAAAPAPTNVSINTEALECPSRVCLLPNEGKQNAGQTGPFCTDNCSGDDDCADGEKRDPNDPADKRCQTGFVCRVVLPKLPGVAKSCQKMCVCKDFLADPSDKTVPMGC